MHINAICPRCSARYQLNPSLRGKKISCPNKSCGEVFEVRENGTGLDSQDVTIASGKFSRTGSVSDLIPMLPAEEAAPPSSPPAAPPPPARETTRPPSHVSELLPLLPVEPAPEPDLPAPNFSSWQDAPPARGPQSEPEFPLPTFDEPSLPGTTPPGTLSDGLPLVPVEVPRPPAPPPPFPSWHEPPPVRGPQGQQELSLPISEPLPASEPSAPPRSRPAAPPRQRGKTQPPAPVEPPPGSENADWREPPQPRDPTTQPGTTPPVELAPGAWQPSPVRTPASTPPEAPEQETSHAAQKTRRAKLLMLGIVVGTLVILGGAGLVAYKVLVKGEEELAARAMKDYDEERFLPAAEQFRKLAERFQESPHHNEYVFMSRLALVRAALEDPQVKPEDALARVDQFFKDHGVESESKALLAQRASDLGKSLTRRMDAFMDAQKAGDPIALEKQLQRVMQHFGQLKDRLPGAIPEAQAMQIEEKKKEQEKLIAKAKKRKEAIEYLRTFLAREPSVVTIRQFEASLKDKAREVEHLENAPDVQRIREGLFDKHRESARFVPAVQGEVSRSTAEDLEPGILLDPLVSERARSDTPFAGETVLALARGVLYGLEASTGQIRWATRVGIDTTHLPMRLPPVLGSAIKRLLILSADTRTLRIFDLAGHQLWAHRLSAPALARPVLVKRRLEEGAALTTVAYLATYDGRVHEIDLDAGRLLGHYNLGQPLSVGGVHQKATDGRDLIYFPADDSCVYVLDVTNRQCAVILYTDHTAGSLRGEPVIVGDEFQGKVAGVSSASFLLLTEAESLDATLLKLYELPISRPRDQPVTMRTPPRIRGWTWFAPHHDGEKIVCLSDAGRLGLFGMKQPANKDSPLFPLVPADEGEGTFAGVNLTELLRPTRRAALPPDRLEEEEGRGRSLVAHSQGEEMWVLAYGQLQRLAVGLTRREGPKATPLWPHRNSGDERKWDGPLSLGSPLHAQQVLEGPAQTSLILVTQPLRRPSCLVTAIDPEADLDRTAEQDPRVYWQRQLGMVCQGEPIVLGDEVLALDQAGGLFRFEPAQFKADATDPWQIGGEAVAGGMDRNSAFPSRLMRGPGRVVYQLASPGGSTLVLRRYDPDGRPALSEQRLDLRKDRPAGDILMLGESVVIPMADGRLVRYPLPLHENTRFPQTRTWRSRLAGPETVSHLAALSPEEFLTTDGGRGLTRWTWVGDVFRPILPPGQLTPPTVELEDRITATPLVLPRQGEDDPLRVIVADSRGTLTLLKGKMLEPDLKWTLRGTVTAGPFLRGPHVGCVLDNNRLVWIDPSKREKLWEYTSSEVGIIGQPQLVEEMVLVCDEGGRFVGIDPVSGKRVGDGYTLKAAVAPAASPVSFGPGRAFAPLTDGTIMMLSLNRLRYPWWRRMLEQ